MIIKVISILLICFNLPAQETATVETAAQFSNVRPKPPADPNKESSSFIGDPENLDPLNSKRESLKEDDEPVLDEIRQVSSESKKTKSIKKLPRKNKSKSVSKNKKNQIEPAKEPWSSETMGRNSEVYIVQKGDTLWTISETLFGDSLFWPKIWAINRQGIVNPNFITPGMKVKFFPGSDEVIPTLAVGNEQVIENEQSNSSGQPVFNSVNNNLNNEAANDDYSTPEPQQVIISNEDQKSNTKPPQVPQDKVLSKSVITPGTIQLLVGVDRPTNLPPSLPVYRSSLYYGKSQKVEIVSLDEPIKIPITYSNDVILTDKLVLSDINIHFESDAQLSCFPGELIEKFDYIRRTKTTNYAIIQPLNKVQLNSNKVLYSYKRIGSLLAYDHKVGQGKLKITECNSYLSKDDIFVPIQIINELKTNLKSDGLPQIIGGPDVFNQNLFTPSQNIFLDMGNLNIEVGRVYNIRSKRIDLNVGKVKILEQFGSYAIGVILELNNSVKIGDTIEL